MREKLLKGMDWMQKNMVSIYVGLMFVFFPLYIRNKLFGITDAKFFFLCVLTIGAAVITAVVQFGKWGQTFPHGWKKRDLLYLAFLFCGVISVCLSSHRAAAFTGTDGRRLGLLLYLIFGMMLVLVTTAEKLSEAVFFGYGFSTVCTGVLGILNHYGIDPLGIYAEIREEQRSMFTATIGNIDFFSVYMAVAFVFFAVLWIKAQNGIVRIFSAFVMLTAGVSVACWSADVGWIGIFLFCMAGWLLVQTVSELGRYFFAAGITFTEIRISGIGNGKIAGAGELEGISAVLTKSSWSVGIAILLALGLFFIQRSSFADKISHYAKAVRRIAAGALIVAVGGLLLLIVCVNTGKIDASSHPFFSYLYLTDEWGTLRGYVWRRTVEYWKQAPFVEKLFGIGPDTAVYVYRQILPDGAPAALSATYDNAHGECLQLLLTHGLFGMLTYYGWWILSVVPMIRTEVHDGRKDAFRLAIGFALTGYLVMMQTCVNSLIVTTIPFLLLCVGKRNQRDFNRHSCERT